MSGQKKIKELTLCLKDAEDRCKLWMDSGVLLSKRIHELEQQNKQMLEVLKIIYKDDYLDSFMEYTHDSKEKMLVDAIESVTSKKIEEVMM